MNYFSHLHTAVTIIGQYRGRQPFHSFAKEFFRQEKKHGSKDRKSITHLCYCYFRKGRAFADAGMEEKIIAGLFLCSSSPGPVLEQLKPEWNQLASLKIEEKMRISGGDPAGIFPWQSQLSTGMDRDRFALSHLVQPDLFLRLRPGFEAAVQQRLSAAGIPFSVIAPGCLGLPNASKLEQVITPDKEAVIQDYNSQRVGTLLKTAGTGTGRVPLHVWDCCAASGGKSIMAKDLLGNIDLTVSDNRASMLAILEKRFAAAGIGKYRSFVADLAGPGATKPSPNHPTGIPASFYDLIIADVPCTGSGTWGRTPERLLFFREEEIAKYSALQRKIVANIIPALRRGGALLYITCSVFAQENETVAAFIQSEFGLKLVRSVLLEGYDARADTLFAALFTTA